MSVFSREEDGLRNCVRLFYFCYDTINVILLTLLTHTLKYLPIYKNEVVSVFYEITQILQDQFYWIFFTNLDDVHVHKSNKGLLPGRFFHRFNMAALYDGLYDIITTTYWTFYIFNSYSYKLITMKQKFIIEFGKWSYLLP